MYKELIICIVIVILVIGVSVFTEYNTKEAVKVMDEKLSKLEEKILNKEEDSLEEQMEEIIKIWKERKEVLAFYIEHDELEKVETELYELKAKIKTEDFEDGLTEIENGIFILNHINEKYMLKIQNIF